jgi:hypothetical protein
MVGNRHQCLYLANNLVNRSIFSLPNVNQMSWTDFLARAVLAGIRFFTAEVLTWGGADTLLVAVLFLCSEDPRCHLAHITQGPIEEWMMQITSRAVDEIARFVASDPFCSHDHERASSGDFPGTSFRRYEPPTRIPESATGSTSSSAG